MSCCPAVNHFHVVCFSVSSSLCVRPLCESTKRNTAALRDPNTNPKKDQSRQAVPLSLMSLQTPRQCLYAGRGSRGRPSVTSHLVSLSFTWESIKLLEAVVSIETAVRLMWAANNFSHKEATQECCDYLLSYVLYRLTPHLWCIKPGLEGWTRINLIYSLSIYPKKKGKTAFRSPQQVVLMKPAIPHC